MRRPATTVTLVTVALAALVAGCATLGELAALRFVDFGLGGTSGGRLAGVDLGGVRDWRDLRATEVVRILDGVRTRRLPLSFVLHVDARNPADNASAARLVRLDWTLFLENRETVSGILDREYLLPAGRTVDIPVAIELDLVRFFDDNAQDLVELAGAVAGRGGSAKQLRLVARPTISTPLGPLSPGEITITERQLGQ